MTKRSPRDLRATGALAAVTLSWSVVAAKGIVNDVQYLKTVRPHGQQSHYRGETTTARPIAVSALRSDRRALVVAPASGPNSLCPSATSSATTASSGTRRERTLSLD